MTMSTNIVLDRRKKIILLQWITQGYIPVEELSNLKRESISAMSDEEIMKEIMEIQKKTDGEEFGGYRRHFLTDGYEKI